MNQNKQNDLEIRAGAPFDVETRDDDDDMRVVGHAAVFDVEADIGGMFFERFERGAFSEVIARDDVRLLLEHTGLPLARTKSKTLTLSEDATGLRVEARLDPTDPDVLGVAPKLRRGDVNQMSIGFSMAGGVQEWDERDDEHAVRTIKKVGALLDVSIVTFPAFPTTDVALRSRPSLVDRHGRALTAAMAHMRMRGARSFMTLRR